jgi:hypothetical protein
MTETEWLACNDPEPMLQFLCGRASSRKLRLFAVACCRRFWYLFRAKSMRAARAAVETAELFADGQVSQEEIEDAAGTLAPLVDIVDGDFELAIQAACAAASAADDCAGYSGEMAAQAAALTTSRLAASAGLVVLEVQAALLRDLFPLGPPIAPDASWSKWRNGLIPTTARAMYRRRDFTEMPVLGDMLDDAGCTEAAILDHCRGPGPHVRGCWVLDLLLGRE